MSYADHDTQPTSPFQKQRSARRGRVTRLFGWLSLFAAAGFAVATGIVLFTSGSNPPAPDARQIAQGTNAPTNTVQPERVTDAAPTDVFPTEAIRVAPAIEPTVNPDQIAFLLAQPVQVSETLRDRVRYEPFTVSLSDQPRTEFINYTAQRDDTINSLAQQFGVQPESIAWCNSRRIVTVLRVGDVVRIPPADGACKTVLSTREETATKLAAEFEIDDPFVILDSPYNPALNGLGPNDIILGGIEVFVPGGQGEAITWNPGYETETDAATGRVLSASFAPGQAGSCGRVSLTQGAYWSNPLSAATWVRGFYAGHTGIDLSARTGTPIYAANSGNVLFSGTSNWGYGITVVLEHGRFSTLYGHMSSVAVGCGQYVNVGQVVGYVGSTGNSSGPHLHFEIRFDDTPVNPLDYPIGW